MVKNHVNLRLVFVWPPSGCMAIVVLLVGDALYPPHMEATHLVANFHIAVGDQTDNGQIAADR